MRIQGAMTAIVTPFKDGRVDEKCLRTLIDDQISRGIDAVVPCGSTGEAVTITEQERDKIIRVSVEQAHGRALVIAGAGSNSTATAISLAKLVKKAGADAMLQVTPYYNKPTQEGLYQHFRAISEVVDLPMVLYNVPTRTAVNMLPETVARLSEIETIVGLKESSGDLKQVEETIKIVSRDFSVISGEDALNLEIYRLGGKGCISVTANIVPDRIAKIWDSFSGGKVEDATRLQEEMFELNKIMFIVTNPIPVKTSLAIMGKCKEEFRLPLTPMGEDTRQKLIEVLRQYKLI